MVNAFTPSNHSIYSQWTGFRNFWLSWKTLINLLSKIPSHQVSQYVTTEICSKFLWKCSFSSYSADEQLDVWPGDQSWGHQAPSFHGGPSVGIPSWQGPSAPLSLTQRFLNGQLESCLFHLSWWKIIWRAKQKFSVRRYKIDIFTEKQFTFCLLIITLTS